MKLHSPSCNGNKPKLCALRKNTKVSIRGRLGDFHSLPRTVDRLRCQNIELEFHTRPNRFTIAGTRRPLLVLLLSGNSEDRVTSTLRSNGIHPANAAERLRTCVHEARTPDDEPGVESYQP